MRLLKSHHLRRALALQAFLSVAGFSALPGPDRHVLEPTCCVAQWGGATKCGAFEEAGGIPGRCNTDWSKPCDSDGQCPPYTPPPQQCTASHGSKAVCCDQDDTAQDLFNNVRACDYSRDRPYCQNYVAHKRLGTCASGPKELTCYGYHKWVDVPYCSECDIGKTFEGCPCCVMHSATHVCPDDRRASAATVYAQDDATGPPFTICAATVHPLEWPAPLAFHALSGDCGGNNMDKELQSEGKSAAECAATCSSEATCAGFSLGSGKGECIPKTASCDTPTSSGYWTFYKRTPGAQAAEDNGGHPRISRVGK